MRVSQKKSSKNMRLVVILIFIASIIALVALVNHPAFKNKKIEVQKLQLK